MPTETPADHRRHCDRPPPGYVCFREPGHPGPCPTYPVQLDAQGQPFADTIDGRRIYVPGHWPPGHVNCPETGEFSSYARENGFWYQVAVYGGYALAVIGAGAYLISKAN